MVLRSSFLLSVDVDDDVGVDVTAFVRWFVRRRQRRSFVVVVVVVRWFVGSLVRWFVGSLVRWFVGSLVRWFVRWLVRWFVGSLVRSSSSTSFVVVVVNVVRRRYRCLIVGSLVRRSLSLLSSVYRRPLFDCLLTTLVHLLAAFDVVFDGVVVDHVFLFVLLLPPIYNCLWHTCWCLPLSRVATGCLLRTHTQKASRKLQANVFSSVPHFKRRATPTRKK